MATGPTQESLRVMRTIAQNSTRLDRLSSKPFIPIGVDTEYQGSQTLTVQTTANFGRTIRVQLYRSDLIPALPEGFCGQSYVSDDCPPLQILPIARITRSLSPVRLLLMLGRISHVKVLDRAAALDLVEGRSNWSPVNGEWDKQKRRWKLKTINIRFIGHFLTADFSHMFGSSFFASILDATPDGQASPLCLPKRKVITLASSPSSFRPPIVEAILSGDFAYLVTVEFRDTSLAFGPGSLDSWCKTFLGTPKNQLLSAGDKENMLRTFRERPADAYGYAIADAVDVLRIHERMRQADRDIYKAFAVSDSDIPQMHATIGRRTVDFLFAHVRKAAEGSALLNNDRELKRLMRMGGLRPFASTQSTSRFGRQTGTIHGGLLFSRSPTCVWHEAPGQLRDVDMSGCYTGIIAKMNMYIGRPVVVEPGQNGLTVKEAVELMLCHAPNDGWLLRVTGPINNMPNTLIPSTIDAVTHQNFRRRSCRARLAEQSGTGTRTGDRKSGAKLFSGEIESGVVTSATWLMIQCLPDAARADFENLVVEAIILYPKRLIAGDGPEYDQLVDELKSNRVPWRQELDLGDLAVRQVEELDHEFVSLRFPVGEVARRIGELRAEAKQKHGKGSGAELTLKLQGNTLFGVISSQHHPTNNVVAGNFITAHARAEAYGMMMSLNALQVVTDGCWYRRDRIPACTFRECLDRMPDYPIRHADETSGVPFLDPSLIPDDDIAFSGWLVNHLCWFFEVNRKEHRRFFATHRFEHKRTGKTGSAAFDAMCCDGAGNYVKLTGDRDSGWHPQESAMRGYRAESKAVLIPWLIRVYQSDRMTELPPITEDVSLLKLDPAKGKARRSLKHASRKAVRLPIGMPMASLHSYQILRPSGFVFRTQKQLRAVQRQLDRLRAATGCGLDLLVLKQNHASRKHGSLSKVAAELYEYLRQGGKDLKKKFHLGSRLSRRLQTIVSARLEAIKSRRTEIERQIFREIAVEPERQPVTGIVVTRENRRLLD